MAAHLAGQRTARFLHLRLDQAVAGLPHQRMAAQFGDAVEQRLARLHIGDDRRARPVLQHRGGIDLQKLVAPDYPALAVDRADPIAVSRSEEHTSELQSLMRISYAVFCLKKQIYLLPSSLVSKVITYTT